MKQYLYSIVAVAVIAALFRVLCPDGTSLKKYFSFLTSAVLLCATVVPAASLLQGFSTGSLALSDAGLLSGTDYSAVWQETLSDTTREETERAIVSHLCEKFSLSEKNLSVACHFTEEDGRPCLSEIEITLFSSALLKNPREIESYVAQAFALPCRVLDGELTQRE